ncbi:MAG: hypothetical protein ACXWCY_17535 [Burkholderiales bacterium]
MKIAVLDDYLHLSQQSADWSKLASTCEIKVFDRRLSVPDEAAERQLPCSLIEDLK